MLRGKKTDLIWKIKQKKVEKYLTLGLTNLREAKQARNLKKKKKQVTSHISKHVQHEGVIYCHSPNSILVHGPAETPGQVVDS